MNENQIMQQAIKTNRGSARSAEQEKRKGKLQVELSLKAFCFFQLIFFSSLALAIARKEARDGLVAIPMSSKKEKVKRKRGEKRRLPGFIYSGGDKLENADEEEEEILAALNDREDYEEVAQFGKNEFSHEITHMSTSSLLKVSRYSCLFLWKLFSVNTPRVSHLQEPGSSRSPSSCSAISCPSSENAISSAASPPPVSPCPPEPSPASPSPSSLSVSCLLDDAASIEEMEAAVIDEDVIGSMKEEEGNLPSENFENQNVLNPDTNHINEAKDIPKNLFTSPSVDITSNKISIISDHERDNSKEGTLRQLHEDQTVDQLHESKKCNNYEVVAKTFKGPDGPGPLCDSYTENKTEVQVLDRFQQRSSDHLCQSLVVEATITGWSVSPFSGARWEPWKLLNNTLSTTARLSPYIRRDTETEPAGLAVLRKFDSNETRLHPIDFCYLQPQLVPAVNCLAEKVDPMSLLHTVEEILKAACELFYILAVLAWH